jgi:hypothetical protein
MKSIPWHRIVLNLRQEYRPVTKLAKEVRCSRDALQSLVSQQTREPRFSVGLALLDLHLDHCPDQHRAMRIVRT